MYAEFPLLHMYKAPKGVKLVTDTDNDTHIVNLWLKIFYLCWIFICYCLIIIDCHNLKQQARDIQLV